MSSNGQVKDDVTRYSVVLSKAHQTHLAQLAKEYKLSQGEIIEVLLDLIGDGSSAKGTFFAKREAKVLQRNDKKGLAFKIKSLTPEQIALIESMTANS